MWLKRIIKILAELSHWVWVCKPVRWKGPSEPRACASSPSPWGPCLRDIPATAQRLAQGEPVKAGQMELNDITVYGPNGTKHTLIRSVLGEKTSWQGSVPAESESWCDLFSWLLPPYQALSDQALFSPGIAYHLNLPLLSPSGEYRTLGLEFLISGIRTPSSHCSTFLNNSLIGAKKDVLRGSYSMAE